MYESKKDELEGTAAGRKDAQLGEQAPNFRNSSRACRVMPAHTEEVTRPDAGLFGLWPRPECG